MKLEGSLDAFGLPDIFQLLSLTKKTGGLQLRSGASAGVVYFSGGAITGAASDLSHQTLARRVVGSGAVDDAALQAAIRRAKTEGLGVSKALLEAGAVDADLVRGAAAEVAVDAVYDLLAWPEGDFAFSVDAVNPDDIGVALTTDQVVSQAGVRKEQIAGVSAEIPSTDMVLCVPVNLPDDPELTRDEWALLALADGRRDVAEIIDLTGRGYFGVVPGLAALVRRGLLEAKDENDDPVDAMRRSLDLLAPLEGSVPAAPAAPAVPAAPAAPAAAESARTPAPPAAPAPEAASEDEPELVSTIGGPHVPTDVVPPRPEPFLAKRQPEHPEAVPAAAAGRLAFAPSPPAAESTGSVFSQPPASATAEAPRAPSVSSGVGGVNGSAAMAADPETAALIERDPSVNRSLLLRLIAGVRGL